MSSLSRSAIIKLVYSVIGLGFIFLGIAFTGQVFGRKWAKAQDAPDNYSPSTSSNIPSDLKPEALPGDYGNQGASELNLPTDDIPPAFDANSDYRYEPVGKRDPFRPFRDTKVGIGQVRAIARPLEPLERFDVKALEVVAIVWANDKPKALIQDPDKQVHSVVKGQRIGKNEGYIADIREGEVVVVELYDLNGKIVKEPYILCIDKRKGCGSR